jgi:hypothetical protein
MRTPVHSSAATTISALRRMIGAAAALALAAVALVAGPAGASDGANHAPGDTHGPKDRLCPDGYVCLHPGGVGVPEPLLIPECGSEYFIPPYIASAIDNHTNVIVWFTTEDGSATWIPPHSSVTLWPVAAIDSVVSQCFVPTPYHP